jgi:hypothetical protein
MDANLLQGMIDIVFKGNMIYLSPILFLLMVVLFADRLIDLIKNAVGETSSRRNKY